MSQIFEVVITKETEILIEAADPQEAEAIAGEVSSDFDFDEHYSVRLVEKPGTAELILCEDGDYQYSFLLELKEWIEAPQEPQEPPPDPAPKRKKLEIADDIIRGMETGYSVSALIQEYKTADE